MNIEFHAPEGQVREWILRYVRFNLIDFYHAYKNISRAEVYFRQESHKSFDNKICEIHLTIFGDSLFVHERSFTYEQASQKVLTTLRQRIDELTRTQHEVPESIHTTVEVED